MRQGDAAAPTAVAILVTSVHRHSLMVVKSSRPHGRENREAIESKSKNREVDKPDAGGVAILMSASGKSRRLSLSQI